nr:MAG TPA: hypothetical protein [Caudoviricetes sp.]
MQQLREINIGAQLVRLGEQHQNIPRHLLGESQCQKPFVHAAHLLFCLYGTRKSLSQSAGKEDEKCTAKFVERLRLQILTGYAIFVTTCSMRHSYPSHKGKEPHRLVKLFSYSKTSDAILRYAFRRYFLTVSGDRFISNATCTQERPRTSHSTRHAISSGGSSKDRMYATARRGAIEDNCARIARCCLSMLCAGACRALTRGEACLPPVFLSLF